MSEHESLAAGTRRPRARVVVVLLLVVLVTIGAVTMLTAVSQRDDARVEVVSLEQAQRVGEAELASAQAAQRAHGVGVDSARLTADTRYLTALARTLFTWDSAASYDAARTRVADDVRLLDSAQLLGSFMPAAPAQRDADGREYHYIDTSGVTSSVREAQVQVVSVRADVVRYWVLVELGVGAREAPEDWGRTQTRMMALDVSIDGAGNVVEIEGIAAASMPRYSR